MQTDPIGYADDLNLYAYVGNDPVNYTDSSGQWAAAGAIWGGIAGGVSGGITGYVQDGWRGARIGTGTGAISGAAVGFVAPYAAAAAGSRAGAVAVAMVGAGLDNLVQQGLTNQTYKSVDPTQVSDISWGVATGAAVAGPVAAGAAKVMTAFGKGVLQGTAGIFGATLPKVAVPVTTVVKIADADYEGSTGAFGEILGGAATKPVTAQSRPKK